MKAIIAAALLSALAPFCAKSQAVPSAPRRVVYHLYISDTMANFTGRPRPAIAINGSIPGPELHFTEGDTAEIHVHNTLGTETSVHWHGLILPNRYDGVSYLTTAPIKARSTHTFEFPLVQNGTYWYHSHTAMQEQSGMYGAFIIHPRKPAPMDEKTVLLSDWTDENPHQVHRSLYAATDWYGIKKGSTQNYAQAIKEGYFGTKVTNEWKRMLAMDVSDVAYDRVLINGRDTSSLTTPRAGDKLRLRVINGSSSSYFWLTYPGGFDVVASDGKDVQPVHVDRLIVGVSETYDLIVKIPDSGRGEFRATTEDRTRSTTMWLGTGADVAAPHLPRLQYFEGMKMMNGMMKMNGDMNDMGMQMHDQIMDMNTVMYPEVNDPAAPAITTLNYTMLRSPDNTTLPPAPTRTLYFRLTGNMNRYVWSINNRTVSETDKILIRKGENIRIVLYNGTMMRHPMHLHGHFFRVVNGQGAYAPLKTVLDIMPMETDTIEFAATESGDWFFHCHILYHMMSGMGRIFSYQDSPPNPEIPNPDRSVRKIYADDRQIHLMGRVALESSGSDGELMLANTRYKLQTEWRLGTNSMMGYESESHLGRYLGRMQFWFPYVGWDFRYRTMDLHGERTVFGQRNTKNNRGVACVGVQYTLPMLVTADARIDMNGIFRLSLMREDIPVTARLRMNLMANSDLEYMVGLRYIVTKYFGISTHYDSDMGLGAGITLNY